jgi:ADP-heptose:LPS heptosyltransferase
LKKETIRALDLVFGTVLCALLTLHRRLFGGVAQREAARAPSRRILFVKLVEQGATVLAYDAIRRAAKRVGRENVFFCVFEENREILDLMDVIPAENVVVIRGKQLSVFLADVLQAIRRVRRLHIDTTIDMEFLSRASAILAYLMGARRRVGLHRFNEEAPYRGDLLTHRLLYNPFVHTARAYSLLVDALDADPGDAPLVKIPVGPPPEPAPPFVPRPEETQRMRDLLDEVAGRRVEPPIVLLNPNCGDLLPLRRWPTEYFVDLGQRLLADHAAVTLVITGAPSERSDAEEVCRAFGSPRAISVAGRTTLREVLVLYGLADVLVTNDSGPGHFASLTSIESVVLFGPGAPSQFGPIGGRSQVLWAGLACSPCANVYNHRFSTCTNNVCMQAITVDEVYVRVHASLTAGSRTTRREQ